MDMDETTQKAITRRLASASGHLKGIERMVTEDVYCIDIIKQIQAVQAAMNKVSEAILREHLTSCVTTAIRGDDPSERARVLDEISEVFAQSKKK